MMRWIFMSFLLLTGCAMQKDKSDEIISMQLHDRNGFSESISSKERLAKFRHVNYLNPQPYRKVLRVYGRDGQGKSSSKITSYHSNGLIHEYLEITDGRAHGLYRQWYENGQLHLETTVIEGTADISDMAKATWLFDGKSLVYNEEGILIADILYEKGLLNGKAVYFYPDGRLEKEIPYTQDLIDGIEITYDPEGRIIEKTPYTAGKKHGNATACWNETTPKFNEVWRNDQLLEAVYADLNGKEVATVIKGDGYQAVFEGPHLQMLIEYRQGIPEGEVKSFAADGFVTTVYHVKDEKKHGEEIIYYHSSSQRKLSLMWQEDGLNGQIQTWYPNGVQESQREMSSNKRHGHSFAWYKDGGLMLVEEYENDVLVKGSYFKKGDKKPVSKIDAGQGVATLHTPEGIFLKKVTYEKGKPLLDSKAS